MANVISVLLFLGGLALIAIGVIAFPDIDNAVREIAFAIYVVGGAAVTGLGTLVWLADYSARELRSIRAALDRESARDRSRAPADPGPTIRL